MSWSMNWPQTASITVKSWSSSYDGRCTSSLTRFADGSSEPSVAFLGFQVPAESHAVNRARNLWHYYYHCCVSTLRQRLYIWMRARKMRRAQRIWFMRYGDAIHHLRVGRGHITVIYGERRRLSSDGCMCISYGVPYDKKTGYNSTGFDGRVITIHIANAIV